MSPEKQETIEPQARTQDKRDLGTNPPRGTHDIMPGASELWQKLESVARQNLQRAGYKEVRTPIFEHTELFKRGVGETTDIVGKEMYTFQDKSDRSLTLRPEGTAGVVRAYLNAGLHRQSPPVKLWYQGPMFRYERPQTGRTRQFNQIGIEALGSAGPLIDAEVIILACQFFQDLGVKDFAVELNSIGDQACRPAYRELLRESLRPKLDKLCADCRDRFERNPLRMLDCKSPTCQAEYVDVPAALDHLCEPCKTHWDELLRLLAKQGIKPTINKRLVRGLDYYTRTAFEFVSNDPRLGAQSTIGAGGRYDNLVEMSEAPSTPGIGWAIGMERLTFLLAESQIESSSVFVVSSQADLALNVANQLRQEGFTCDLDFPGQGDKPRNFSKQLQQANKSGAAFVIVLGDDEIAKGEAQVKDMKDGQQNTVEMSALAGYLRERIEQQGSNRTA